MVFVKRKVIKMKIGLILTLTSFLLHNGCKAQNDPEIKKDPTSPVFVISPEIEYQQIRGFGASDAWTNVSSLLKLT